VRAGEVVDVGAISHGSRLYLAVRGGIDVPRVLASRSTDTLTGLGPPPLRQGMQVAVGDEHDGWPGVDLAPRPAYDPSPVLTVLPGPHAGEFPHPRLTALFGATYQVTPESNRVALRLGGPPTMASVGEVASLGIVTGAIQLPPSGQPILFLNDHPTTGGYPIVGMVVTTDVRRAAQLRPGDTLRFRFS
jgi:allophanate hydrolase subunit 2